MMKGSSDVPLPETTPLAIVKSKSFKMRIGLCGVYAEIMALCGCSIGEPIGASMENDVTIISAKIIVELNRYFLSI
jgi:putative Mn2+ efflux pump MntP